MSTHLIVYTLARGLCLTGNTMSASDLARFLNKLGSTYNPNGRGIYTEISAAYEHIKSTMSLKDAEMISQAYTNSKGEYQW